MSGKMVTFKTTAPARTVPNSLSAFTGASRGINANTNAPPVKLPPRPARVPNLRPALSLARSVTPLALLAGPVSMLLSEQEPAPQEVYPDEYTFKEGAPVDTMEGVFSWSRDPSNGWYWIQPGIVRQESFPSSYRSNKSPNAGSWYRPNISNNQGFYLNPEGPYGSLKLYRYWYEFTIPSYTSHPVNQPPWVTPGVSVPSPMPVEGLPAPMPVRSPMFDPNPGPGRIPGRKLSRRKWPRPRSHSQNVTLTVYPSGKVALDLDTPAKPPPRGVREKKAAFGSRGYWFMRHIADAAGEAVEFLDILGEAAGAPKYLSPAETVSWLFLEGGIQNVDWVKFNQLLLDNKVEDWTYGKIGEGSKGASQELGLSFGVQSGLAL